MEENQLESYKYLNRSVSVVDSPKSGYLMYLVVLFGMLLKMGNLLGKQEGHAA